MLPTPTDDAIISQLSYASWKKTTITYSFLDFWYLGIDENMLPTDPDTGLAIAGPENFLALSEAHKSAFNLVQGLWDDLIAPSLQAVADFTTADIKVARFIPAINQSVTTWESSPDQSPFSNMDDAYVWMYLENEDIGFGYSYRAILHEFAHALGLDHAGDYNFSADPSDASSAQDTTVYTVMSYFGPDRSTGEGYVEQANWIKDEILHVPQTPMMNDILAMQAMYGADLNTRSNATTYGFNASGISGREGVFNFDANKVPIVCIYDAGGIDTLDLSGWEQGSVISLIPGTFSDGNGMTKNISIARGTVIENAVGGAGNDVITGNDAANVLVGGKGNDKLIGGQLTAADIDTVDYSTKFTANLGMTGGIRVNMSLASNQVTNDGFGNQDNLVSIEKIIGTQWHDFIYVGGSLKIIEGGGGTDKVSFGYSTAAVQIDLNAVIQRGGSAEGVQLIDIQEADGSQYNDTIRLKNTGYTSTFAASGNDTIYGGLEISLAYGDVGYDTFYYRGGVATFHGGKDTDVLNLSLVNTGIVLNHAAQTGRVLNSQADSPEIVFSGVETFVGSSGRDEFQIGNQIDTWNNGYLNFEGGGEIDTLNLSSRTTAAIMWANSDGSFKSNNGRAYFKSIENVIGTNWNDRLVIGNGATSANGGDGYDILDITLWWTGEAKRYLETGEIVFSGGNALKVDSIEEFVARPGQIGIVGTDAAETFLGSTGPDKIWGMGGDDVFEYSAGNDQYWGGDGNDTFTVNKGDVIDGGQGYDTVHLKSYRYTAEDIAKFANIDEFRFEGEHQNLTFGPTGDGLTIYLSWGSDTIRFADSGGVKTIYAGDGADTIFAWGNGFYDGGIGTDTLDLSQMASIELDKQLKQVRWGDAILQYDNFEAFKLNTRQGITIRGDGSNEGLSGSIYDWKQDVLDGRGGNDTLVSTGGGDILTGGTGSDTFRFRSSADAAIVTDFERGIDTLIGDFNPGWTPPWWEQHGDDQWLVHDGSVIAKLLNVGTDPISITYETPWV